MKFKPYINLKQKKNIRYSTYKVSGLRAAAALSQRIICIETSEEFNSMTEVSKKFNIPLSTLSISIRMNTKAKGYTFKKSMTK